MAPTQRDSKLCLLLLLGLMGMLTLINAPPAGFTPAQWFVVEHVNMTSNQCTIAMQVINYHRYTSFQQRCKGENTFIHTQYAAITNLCYSTNITCSDGYSPNCYRSPAAVNLTYCNLTGPALPYQQCQYQQVSFMSNYTIACNRNHRPVHFDGF